MKAQSKSPARCRKESSPSGRLHPQANIRQLHPVSSQPTLAIQAQNSFTIEEHLRVQREIEERAHRFWFAKGCALKSALDDWLKAEAEVLAEFAQMMTQRQQMQPAADEMQTKTGKTSTFLPAIPYQSTAKANPKLTAAFQHCL
jgi:hypothetical protein